MLQDIASLRKLDVSGCAAISLDMLPSLTQLHTLVLQRLDMAQPVATAATATTGNNAAEATAASAAALPMANLQNNNAVNPPAVAGWVQVPANVPAGAPGVHVEFAAVPVAAAAGMDLDLNPRVKRHLPDLGPLGKSLTALSLSSNRFTSLPACLSKLTSIELLDFRGEHAPMQACHAIPSCGPEYCICMVCMEGIRGHGSELLTEHIIKKVESKRILTIRVMPSFEHT